MVTHPRVMESTVRKTDDRRKRKRAEKTERRAAEQDVQQQEVKRLKNLKGQQIQDRCAESVGTRQCSEWLATISFTIVCPHSISRTLLCSLLSVKHADVEQLLTRHLSHCHTTPGGAEQNNRAGMLADS